MALNETTNANLPPEGTSLPASGNRRPPPLSTGTTTLGGTPTEAPSGQDPSVTGAPSFSGSDASAPIPGTSAPVPGPLGSVSGASAPIPSVPSVLGTPSVPNVPGVRTESMNPRELLCLTSPIMDVRVCAPQRGGLLVRLAVQEMDEVAEGDLIAQLDDRMVRQSLEAAQARVKAAQEEAAKDISIRYAQEAKAAADKNLAYSQDANNRIPNSIVSYEIRRYELKCKETALQIEQAEYEQDIAKLKLAVAEAEAAAAAVEVDIRQAKATTSGLITERYRNEGEWLQPGMPIVRLVRMDQLYVRGHAPASLYEPYELQGRSVQVRLQLSRGRTKEVESTISFSSPLVDTDGTFLVQAIVPNVREGEEWLLRPGMEATMTLLEPVAVSPDVAIDTSVQLGMRQEA